MLTFDRKPGSLLARVAVSDPPAKSLSPTPAGEGSLATAFEAATDFSRVPATAKPIQRKAQISAPADAFEQEADAVADKVMRMAQPLAAVVQRKCEGCKDEDPKTLQKKPADAANAAASLDADGAVRAAQHGGQPLPDALRSFFEPRFGQDFSRVRVHADGTAANAARAVRARAYTVGRDIVFGSGEYAPATASGSRLLAHELTHVVQQGAAGRRKTASGLGAPGEFVGEPATAEPLVIGASGSGARIARDPDTSAQDAANEIKEALAVVGPVAGVGDFPKVFSILSKQVQVSAMLGTLDKLAWFDVDLIRANIGSASSNAERIEFCCLASVYKRQRSILGVGELARARALAVKIAPADLAEVRTHLGAHLATLFLEGEDKELNRLAGQQATFFEEQRKQEEADEKKSKEDEAKKAGKPPPKTAPKVDMGALLEKKTKERGFSEHPTTEWDKADQKDWKDRRAPAAWNKVVASVKGTELEKVLSGKTYRFEPETMLKNGWFAYQAGNALVFGMDWVRKAEADAKNVWPNVAHELGGHFEYGDTYAGKIIAKAIDQLPEPARTEWKKPEKSSSLFLAYQYSETEVFACLRALRYFDPPAGTKPDYGGLDPYVNIDNNFKKIKTGFPPAVAEAILLELKNKVGAAPEILDRDKKYFTDRVKLLFGLDLK